MVMFTSDKSHQNTWGCWKAPSLCPYNTPPKLSMCDEGPTSHCLGWCRKWSCFHGGCTAPSWPSLVQSCPTLFDLIGWTSERSQPDSLRSALPRPSFWTGAALNVVSTVQEMARNAYTETLSGQIAWLRRAVGRLWCHLVAIVPRRANDCPFLRRRLHPDEHREALHFHVLFCI